MDRIDRITEGEYKLLISKMEPKKCVIPNCDSNSIVRPELSFFSVPKLKSVREEWLDILGHLAFSQQPYVCELHFRVKDFRIGPKKELKPHAVPVLKLGKGFKDPIDSEDEFLEKDSENENKPNKFQSVKIKQEPLSDEEFKQTQVSSITCSSGRRPSRRAAIVAAQKISDSARSYSAKDDPDFVPPVFEKSEKPISIVKVVGTVALLGNSSATPARNTFTPLQNTSTAVQNTSTPLQNTSFPLQNTSTVTPAPAVNISLDMECCEEALSETQTEILQEAQNQYNLVMKGLKDLVQCSGKMVQTDVSGTMILNTLPFPTQTVSSIPPLNSIQPNTLFLKTDNSKMIPISISGNTKPSYYIL